MPARIGGRRQLGGSQAFAFTDDFDRADGALGNGWEGATWAIVSGKAVNTPAIDGTEKLGNPGFETWTNATTPGTWGKTTAGTSSVNQESSIVHGGTYACRLDVDASLSNVLVLNTVNLAVFNPMRLRGWLRTSAPGVNISVNFLSTGAIAKLFDPGATWTQIEMRHATHGQQYIIQVNRSGGSASQSIYLDDFSLQAIVLANIFAARNFGSAAPQVVRAALTQVGGFSAGVVTNLDNPANPLNYVVAFHSGPSDGTQKAALVKVVNGLATSLIDVAATYSAGAMLEIRRTSDGKYQLWYNNVQRGTDQTIADAGIVNNTYHGMYSLYEGNSVDSFFVGTP